MRKSGGVSGAVSLVMIFCVMCLTVFAALTLATAERERRLTEMAAKNAECYYKADYDAARVAASLQSGAPLPHDLAVDVAWDGDTASFLLPIGDSLGLEVAVSIQDGACDILRWRTVYTANWEPEAALNLRNGN